MFNGKHDDKDAFREWSYGVDRGERILNFLSEKVITKDDLKNFEVLDIGCGFGGISIAFSKASRTVISADIDSSYLKHVNKRIIKNKVRNMYTIRLDGASLPFRENLFDLILVCGVLEWIPTLHQNDPQQIQLRALSEFKHVLKDTGILYLAIENRYYLRYFFGFKDHSGLPFASILPRGIANMYSKIAKGNPYKTYLYSYHTLKEVLEKVGFVASFHVGLRSYQFPTFIESLDNKKGLLNGINQVVESKFLKLGAKILLSLGLFKLFSPNFIVIARKAQVVN